MAGEPIHCEKHGDSTPTYVCEHLAGNSVRMGFNSDPASEDNLYPDAWCNDCELIRTAHGGWTEESEKLLTAKMLCADCYNATRIRNTRIESTLADLATLKWKCGACDEWHYGPMLDVGYDEPDYWRSDYKGRTDCFANSDFCVIENRDYFVRGVIHLPIIGTDETFRWGVWGSLGRENFEKMRAAWDGPEYKELPQMFSWLSTSIQGYPETLNLKMNATVIAQTERPYFLLEKSDHPLAIEFHYGISPTRVREIMEGRLDEFGG